MMHKNHLLSLTLLLALTACADEEKPRVTYRLNGVVPSVAYPGDTITLAGTFPENATVLLNSVTLSTNRKAEGLLDAQIPSSALAGEGLLQVSGTTLQTAYDVLPKITAVTLKSNTLQVQGLGWAGGQSTLMGSIQGVKVTPTLQGEALVMDLPANLVYGPLNITVSVNNKQSPVFYHSLQAAVARGKVLLPAQAQNSITKSDFSPQALPVPTFKSLAVYLSDLSHQASLETKTQEWGGKLTQCYPSFQACRATFQSPQDAQRALQNLSDLPYVTNAHPDDVKSNGNPCTNLTQNPATLGELWHLKRMNIEKAWQKTLGKGITVAVVDSGVLPHPEFENRLLPGIDFVDGDTNPVDLYGHGTHVAGLVAANLNIKGVAPAANILPVRVLNSIGEGSVLDVAQGVLYAAGLDTQHPNPNPAQVINLSLGLRSYNSQMPALEQAIEKVQKQGVLVVAATGNDSLFTPAFPANLPGVISVTALSGPTTTYQPTYPNRGQGTLLSAFGGDLHSDQDKNNIPDAIVSTAIDGNTPAYGLCYGTSMAAPQVSGVVALLLAQGTPPRDVIPLLTRSAIDLGDYGQDLNTGFGLVNPNVTDRKAGTYMVALNPQNKVVAWAPVQNDGTYTLTNLPPSTPLKVQAFTDLDGNHVLGETGETLSPALQQEFQPQTQTPLPDLQLDLVTTPQGVTLPEFQEGN